MPTDRGGVGSDRAQAVRRIEDRNSLPWYRLPWGFVLKRTMRSFTTDQCTDLAAGLTYFAVLSLFPALLALVSLLGIVGQSKEGIGALFQMAIEKAGSIDPKKVRDELARLNVMTFWGPVKFGPNGQINSLEPPVLQIQNGKTQVIYPPAIKQVDFKLGVK